MRRTTGSRNPMIHGGSNMLSSTSGSSARKPTAGQAYSNKMMDGLMGGQGDIGHIDPSQARQQMAARDFQLTPGGQQMGRFQQLAAIRANPAQSGYAQMMAQAGGQTQQPQGMYPGSMAANEHSQNALAGYQERGGMGMNIKQGANGRYALTSAANTGPRSQTANPLSGNKMLVDGQGIEASLGNTEGSKYQIDADTLPAYREGAARQQGRIQNAREANGGLSSRDVTKLSKIEQMVASGRTTKPQAAAQLRNMQGRHGLANNDRIQSVIDRMEEIKKTSGQENSRKSIGDSSGSAFSRPMMQPGKYTPSAIAEASENVRKLQSLPSMQALGIGADTDFDNDIDALAGNVSRLADKDLNEWAAVFSEKIAATNGEFMGSDPTAGSIAKRIAKLVDSGKMEEARAEAQGLQKHRRESQKMKITKPSDLWKSANETLLSMPIPASPNTGKL